jgi:hypothetical protein
MLKSLMQQEPDSVVVDSLAPSLGESNVYDAIVLRMQMKSYQKIQLQQWFMVHIFIAFFLVLQLY